jgi:hypothetical protein
MHVNDCNIRLMFCATYMWIIVQHVDTHFAMDVFFVGSGPGLVVLFNIITDLLVLCIYTYPRYKVIVNYKAHTCRLRHTAPNSRTFHSTCIRDVFLHA